MRFRKRAVALFIKKRHARKTFRACLFLIDYLAGVSVGVPVSVGLSSVIVGVGVGVGLAGIVGGSDVGVDVAVLAGSAGTIAPKWIYIFLKQAASNMKVLFPLLRAITRTLTVLLGAAPCNLYCFTRGAIWSLSTS